MTAQGRGGRSKEKIPFYKQVADKLIEQIEQGTAPWQKPWIPDLPLNPVSGTRYRGANTLMLMAQGREDNRWMTYNQAAANGYQVRRGERATPVQYWKLTDEIPKLDSEGKPVLGSDGKPEKVTVELQKPKVFTSFVFNAEQIDGVPPREKREITWNPHERAEKVLRDSGAKISNDQADRAYYSPRLDEIHLPKKEQFPDQERYYDTAMHELGHWTGHESRLNRDIENPFGTQAYAKEELRAEIASVMVCGELGLKHDSTNNAGYVQSWVSILKEQPMEICRAAQDAEKAFGYILGRERALEHDAEQKELAEKTPETEKTERSQQFFDKVAAERLQRPESMEFSGAFNVHGCAENEAGQVSLVPDSEARFFGVYALNKDGTETHIKDFPTKEMATEMADTITNRQAEQTAAPEAPEERQYINVHYKERADAKELGARYDADRTSWYIPSGVDAKPFLDRWPEHQPAQKAERQILSVPYKEKHLAKAAGARWDETESTWYVGPKGDMDKLKRWLPDNQKRVENEPSLSPRDEFTQVLRNMGAVVNGPHPIFDKELHRIPEQGDKQGETSIMYRVHPDGRPAGYAKNHRTGEEVKWSAKGYSLTAEEKKQIQTTAKDKVQERSAELKKMHEATAAKLTTQAQNMKPPEVPTPYMEAKGIGIHAGALASGKTLCVPGHDAAGKIKTMVYIQEDGVKRYAKDSHKEGAFHAVGGMDALKKAPVLVVAEGYATAASIAEAVGHATVSAFDAGNLKHAAKALQKAMPDKPIVIAGDNDRHFEEQGKPNRGKLAAIDAANSVGGVAIFPTFPESDYAKDPKGLTDFNDMVNKTSLDKVTAQEHIKAAMSREAVKEKAQLQERSHQREAGEERKPEIKRPEEVKKEKNTGMTR